MKKCIKCGKEKDYSCFPKRKDSKDGVRNDCIDCRNIFNKKYREINKEDLKKKNLEYYNKNKGVQFKKRRDRIRNDILFKTKCSIRSQLSRLIKQKKIRKSSLMYKVIGCSLDCFKEHLEKQFTKGMTWDNYGEWTIDHIIPLKKANTIHDVYKLSHYSNLQPLWKMDNLEKADKYE